MQSIFSNNQQVCRQHLKNRFTTLYSFQYKKLLLGVYSSPIRGKELHTQEFLNQSSSAAKQAPFNISNVNKRPSTKLLSIVGNTTASPIRNQYSDMHHQIMSGDSTANRKISRGYAQIDTKINNANSTTTKARKNMVVPIKHIQTISNTLYTIINPVNPLTSVEAGRLRGKCSLTDSGMRRNTKKMSDIPLNYKDRRETQTIRASTRKVCISPGRSGMDNTTDLTNNRPRGKELSSSFISKYSSDLRSKPFPYFLAPSYLELIIWR